MAVQWVNRPNSSFRGYAGRIASGTVRPGDVVSVLPSGQTARIERIVTFDGDLSQANQGQSVAVTLDRELDCSRGDVIVSAAERPALAGGLSALLVWLSDEPLATGRSYWLTIGAQPPCASARHFRLSVTLT